MADLWPHQSFGARWLTEKPRRVLADDCGLGKTIQVVRAATALGIDRVLVACPALARENWRREWARWWARKDLPRRAPQVLTTLSDHPAPRGPVICSHEYARANVDTLAASGPWACLVVDEVHRVTGINADRSRKLLGTHGLIHSAKRFWGLSGTPARNHPGELWPLVRACGVTTMGYSAWVSRYCVGKMKDGKFVIRGARKENVEELRRLLEGETLGAGFMLRRRAEEVQKDLPPVTFEDLVIEPGEVDLETSDKFLPWVIPTPRLEELAALLADQTAALAVATIEGDYATLAALAKSVSTLRRYVGMQKIDPVVKLIRSELADGLYGQVVVGTLHREVTEGIRSGLHDLGAMAIYGGTDPKKRETTLDRFQRGRFPVLVTQIQAAGEAVNLSCANQAIQVEQSWVSTENYQWAKRLQRPPQKLPVFIRTVMLPDSIDQAVARKVRRATMELEWIFGAPADAPSFEFDAI